MRGPHILWTALACLWLPHQAGADPTGMNDRLVITPKKGVGHWGHKMPEAPDVLGCSWYYNWGPKPASTAAHTKAAFVPMFWSGKDVTPENVAYEKASSHGALLGFNEPDGDGQANMTVEESLALWPQLEATGLRLGSPGTTTGARWLDEFMAGAKSRHLRVDFLCLHWYGDITAPDAVGRLKKYLAGYWNRYYLPIWLTEYSGANFDYHVRKATEQDNAEFAKASVEMMETLPYVERYAWFAPLVSADDQYYPTVALISPDGSFTPVGLAWRTVPVKR